MPTFDKSTGLPGRLRAKQKQKKMLALVLVIYTITRMTNPYYSPEALGLEQLACEDNAGSYEFDMCVLWKHTATGRLFYAFDSGCSCPCPFENEFFSFENGEVKTSLQEVTVSNWEGAAQEMSSHLDKDATYKMLKEYFKTGRKRKS